MHAKDDPRLVRFRDGFWFSRALLRREAAELEDLRSRLRPEARDDLLHAVATVWHIVDTVHRVRELAQATPGMNQREPLVRGFLAATIVAEDFRHYAQHLQRELANPHHKFPVWGAISWINTADPGTTFTAVTGAVAGGTEISGAVYDRLERRWASRVSLSVGGVVFNVDPAVDATASLCDHALAAIAALQPGLPPLDNLLSFLFTAPVNPP